MLKKDLASRIKKALGAKKVFQALEDRICYAYDASQRQSIPDLVVIPETVQEVASVMQIANKMAVPVVPRGAGSGMSGGSIPVCGGIVMAMTHFQSILEIDTDNLMTVVQPGVITSTLQEAVEEQGLFYPPDPASQSFSTIGGNIAENAGGMRAVKYGVTQDYVQRLEVVLPNGRVVHTGSKCVKDVVGYNLTQLFVGCEGTLGIITEATLRLLPLPENQKTMSVTFPSIREVGYCVSEIIKRKIIPTTLEFLDHNAIWSVNQYLDLGVPQGTGAFMLIEVDGPAEQVDKDIFRVAEICREIGSLNIDIAESQSERKRLWKARRSVSASLAWHNPVKKINEDIVVPRASLPDMVESIEQIADETGMLIVNFGHAGDGNIHVNVLVKEDTLAQAHVAVRRIFEKTVQLGGCITGEHGVGISKQDFIDMNLEPSSLDLMRAIKNKLDPHGILNPGKIFPEDRREPINSMDSNHNASSEK